MYNVRMLSANDTAERDLKPVKGIYLMTDILGNQKRVKVVPAEKSVLVEMLEDAPKLRMNKVYKDFLYKKGSVRIKFAEHPVYCWNSEEFKVYAGESEPLYFEFENRT